MLGKNGESDAAGLCASVHPTFRANPSERADWIIDSTTRIVTSTLLLFTSCRSEVSLAPVDNITFPIIDLIRIQLLASLLAS